GFRRTGSGRIVARLGRAERDLLASLARQIATLVAPAPDDADSDPLARLVGIEDEAVTPTDPALARLLPDAYGEDEAAKSADFRRFTERSLREGKVANARTVIETLERSGDKVTLSAAEAQAWLSGLNDIRLALGARLELADDPDLTEARIADLVEQVADLDPAATGPAAEDALAAAEELATFQVYDLLTYLQETLVQAVMAPPPRRSG
ncbi:MAG TPA: DUF2017 domain-containing protein, partial [Candidatus Nanopelagicales bacterium]|nr:DUF2017 domain-containing protein [Candidatus Nanopelagicales bacterium]